MAAEGGEGRVLGVVVPGFDFQDTAYWETGWGVFVEEGAAGGGWVEFGHVFFFEEFAQAGCWGRCQWREDRDMACLLGSFNLKKQYIRERMYQRRVIEWFSGR